MDIQDKHEIKIFYDHEILISQKYGGVSRYFFEIITEMRRSIPDVKPVIKAAISCNYYFRKEIKMRDKLPKHGNGFRNSLSAVIEIIKAKMSGHPYDIIHPTFFFPDYLYRFPGLKGKAKVVITVHDFVYERLYPEYRHEIEEKSRAMHFADGLICVSEKTRQDMFEFYPELRNKPSTVIYHGFTVNSECGNSDYPFPDKYILYVGGREGYKNFDTALKGFAGFKSAYQLENVIMLAVGGGPFSDTEKKQIGDLGLSDSVIQDDLSDRDLSEAYKKAVCFIYPSLYEGFGIPILEAFSAGCPVVLSRCSCFPEIAGGGALYFEGNDFNELSEVIYRIFNFSEEERKKIIEDGYRRLEMFSWSKAAKETVSFYKELLECR